MNQKLRRVLLVGFILSFVLLFSPLITYLQDHFFETTDLPPLPKFLKDGHPKMDWLLYRLMQVYFDQGIDQAKEFANLRKIDMTGYRVRAIVEAQMEGMDNVEIQALATSLRLQIESFGGTFEAAHKQLIQSLLPIDSLQGLADLPTVRYIHLPIKPKIGITSEGVTKTGANRWQSIAPYRSEAAKVCILDLGFKGYESLLGIELPTSVVTRSFRSDHDLSADEVHGAACAEIVHDMAPDAGLWLANFSTFIEMSNAVDWVIKEGVNIISASFGTNYYPADGTGPACEVVKEAHNRGVIWINAAGNEAEDHWAGNFDDWDNDRWLNFLDYDELLEFDLPAYVPVEVFVRWNDWGAWNGLYYRGSDQDYDLYLYIKSGSSWLFVDKSTNYQTGFQDPVEEIWGWYTTTPARWGIAIYKYSASRPAKFDAFISTHLGRIEYWTSGGSIASPGDSPYSITVGAVDWSDDSYHSYSSQGPTADGRIKPDLCAPSAVSTVSYGEPFYGTSSACPHVAGAFALLKGKMPYSLDQVRNIIESRAIDLGISGKDNKFGLGRLNLSKTNEHVSKVKRYLGLNRR